MSLNFTPTDIAGGQYHRSNKVIFSNPIEAKDDPTNRSVLFILEQVTVAASGDKVVNDAGFVSANVVVEERDEVVPLIDLVGNEVGTIPLGELTDATLLYINSFMIHTASKQGRI